MPSKGDGGGGEGKGGRGDKQGRAGQVGAQGGLEADRYLSPYITAKQRIVVYFL